MVSKDGEVLKFCRTLTCDGQVEVWLKTLEDRMRESLMELVDVAKTTADLWD